jgi:hypothetical protein
VRHLHRGFRSSLGNSARPTPRVDLIKSLSALCSIMSIGYFFLHRAAHISSNSDKPLLCISSQNEHSALLRKNFSFGVHWTISSVPV